jgi:xanthine dehydrogenase accessory factor
LRYGVSADENARLGLPCGGHLSVLLQRLGTEDKGWLSETLTAVEGRSNVERVTSLKDRSTVAERIERYREPRWQDDVFQQCFGPCQRLLLVGAGQLAASVAELALGLDYEVLVCDPRDDARDDWRGPAVPLIAGMPDDAVRSHADDPMSIVITLTHDPRIDDMALMEALESQAWYVGALGSQRTTEERVTRLRTLGLSEAALGRLHAPVGIDIGSKTPPEIAISILAELTRLRRRGV